MIKEFIMKCPCCGKINKVQISFSKDTDDVKIVSIFAYKEDLDIKNKEISQEELFEKTGILLGTEVN